MEPQMSAMIPTGKARGMRWGEGTAGGEMRESRGREAGEAAGALGCPGAGQGQEEGRSHSLRVWDGSGRLGSYSFMHSSTHSLFPGRKYSVAMMCWGSHPRSTA